MTYMLITLGVVIGFTLRCAITAVADYRDPPVTRWKTPPREHQPPTPTDSQRWSASDVLGYYDFGLGWQAPTYPRGSYPTALARWRALHPKRRQPQIPG